MATQRRAGFVYAEGREFKLDGQPFRHVGVNISQLLYQPENQLIRELNGAQDANVRHVRLWLPNDLMQGEIVTRLRRVLDNALARGIRVTVALTHNYCADVYGWDSPTGAHHIVAGDEDHYSRKFAAGPMLSDHWIDHAYTKNYRPFVDTVVTAFKDHAGVFGWDIANEVNVSNTATEDPGNDSGRWLVDRSIDFYVGMAARIKAIDPYHLVTTGAISTFWLGARDTEKKKRLYGSDARESIDYVVIHEYNDFHDDNVNKQKDDIRRANDTWFKPVIVEEFGMSREVFGDQVFEKVSAYFEDRYARGDTNLHVDCVMQYGASFIPELDTGNNHWDREHPERSFGPIAQGLFEQYVGLWRTWGDRLSSSTHEIAFQANTGNLWTVRPGGGGDRNLGMMAGTSPSITELGTGGHQIAFQANTGMLWSVGAAGDADRRLGMMAGTSPTIAPVAGGGHQIAFQANTGMLWSVGAAGDADRRLGMMAGTSPSIAELAGGGHQIAFQANTGMLWSVGAAGDADRRLGMMAGTSPSIAALPDGGYVIAFQANTGKLWIAWRDGAQDFGLGMMAGTSPSIAALSHGGYVIAFQANTGKLWAVWPGGHRDFGLGMKSGTSPSIATVKGGGYVIAFQANTGDLWTAGTGGPRNLRLGLLSGTSPSITR